MAVKMNTFHNNYLMKKNNFSFYFTNASLALFANGINWVDGLLSTIIMAILSILICFFVIMFCRDMLVNDDEEKDELRVSEIMCAQNDQELRYCGLVPGYLVEVRV